MKKNMVLYYVCKGLNWIHWFIIWSICYIISGNKGNLDWYGAIIFLSTILYVIFWFAFKSRILYQMCFFLGYIYAEYCLLFSPTDGLKGMLNIHDASVIQKIILTLACICAFTHKIYTMIYATEDYKSGASRQYNIHKEKRINSQESSSQVSRNSSGLTKEQQKAIFEINRKYKEGCAAIVKANGDNGAWANSDKTNREIAQLRRQLEQEAEQKGVKGKVSIY